MGLPEQNLARRVRTVAEFGGVVQETRRLRRWTQAELARRARVSRRWIIALDVLAGRWG